MACLNIMAMSQGQTVTRNTMTIANAGGASPCLSLGCSMLISHPDAAMKITTCTTLMET